MNMNKVICLLLVLFTFAFPCSYTVGIADTKSPIVLTCWVYYNGVQELEFNELLERFNNTIGLDEGIFVQARSMGGVSELAETVISAASKEAGAPDLPDFFASYADTAYELYQLGEVADLSDYLSNEELNQYIDAYIQEGKMGTENALVIFPVAKSTELLLLNQTAWSEFAAATDADEGDLSTWEGIVRLSEAYYQWTDARTPDVANDGQAFFGRDAVANYMLSGSLQLGKEIFSSQGGSAILQFDREIMKKLWDHLYVPYVNGWFCAYGRFRSDDIKTGQIIALVGSTSGALYFPDRVTNDDGTSYPIQCSVHLLPNFEGTPPIATQQGAGFVVAKSTPEREKAAVTFLKWFTEPDQNLLFSLSSGYLPVTKEGNTLERITAALNETDVSPIISDILTTGLCITSTYQLYTNRPFDNGYNARKIIDTTMVDAANSALEERAQLMEMGMSHSEAIAKLTSIERFEAWLRETEAQLVNVLSQ